MIICTNYAANSRRTGAGGVPDLIAHAPTTPAANADGARLSGLLSIAATRTKIPQTDKNGYFLAGCICRLILLSGLMLCRRCPCLLPCLSLAPAGLTAGVYCPGALCFVSCCPSLLCLCCPLPHSCGGWPVLRGRGVNALYMRACAVSIYYIAH